MKPWIAITGLCALMATTLAADSLFQLKPDYNGPCRQTNVVDVNLGNTPETFVRAAYGQINGQEPDAGTISTWAARLRSDKDLRRIDVVMRFARDAGKKITLSYSNPWMNNPELPPASGVRTSKRDVGAIVMFFFHCPGATNCGMDWANTHAPGMAIPDATLGWGAQPTGYYVPSNPGFWKHELRDAKAAGLQFILPNTYGPDISEGSVRTLAMALAQENDPVKVGMFDDTWPWGEKWFGPYWEQKPDLSRTDYTAKLLYIAKWKPFFSEIPRKNWYLIDGKPLIYFYSAGKLHPMNRAASVLKEMKQLFKADFGVEPFVSVDRDYFQDPDMPSVADAKFIWDPLKFPDGYIGMSQYQMKGKRLCQAMVKWDPVGRDSPGKIADSSDHLIKGPELLQKVLKDSSDADFLVFATWNDLGEGTGINRNYDYWYMGRWLAPDTFMSMIREAQFR